MATRMPRPNRGDPVRVLPLGSVEEERAPAVTRGLPRFVPALLGAERRRRAGEVPGGVAQHEVTAARVVRHELARPPDPHATRATITPTAGRAIDVARANPRERSTSPFGPAHATPARRPRHARRASSTTVRTRAADAR